MSGIPLDGPKPPEGHFNKGYWIIRTPNPDDPSDFIPIAEHRHVMEGILGRKLLLNETVHHKNGVRNDNRPENLELWASAHPSGQRVSDLVSFAKKILEAYGDVSPAAL